MTTRGISPVARRRCDVCLRALAIIAVFQLAGWIGLFAQSAVINSSSAGYTLAAWTVQTGLPAGDVIAITQDLDGYLWLGTSTGLIRFDGAEFTARETLDQDRATGGPRGVGAARIARWESLGWARRPWRCRAHLHGSRHQLRRTGRAVCRSCRVIARRPGRNDLGRRARRPGPIPPRSMGAHPHARRLPGRRGPQHLSGSQGTLVVGNVGGRLCGHE